MICNLLKAYEEIQFFLCIFEHFSAQMYAYILIFSAYKSVLYSFQMNFFIIKTFIWPSLYKYNQLGNKYFHWVPLMSLSLLA